jgi:hypothetical protein
LATQVWCLAVRPQAQGALARTKLKNYRKQNPWSLLTPSHQQIDGEAKLDNLDRRAGGGTPPRDRLNFGIRDPWRRIGLRFWMQRKRYWTLARLRRMLSSEPGVGAGLVPAPIGHPQGVPLHTLGVAPPGLNEGLERAVRSRVFRLAKPGAIERYRYSLTAKGDPDWEREPWKTLRRATQVKRGVRG